MRSPTRHLLLPLIVLAGGVARADEPPKPPAPPPGAPAAPTAKLAPPPTPEQAADAVLAAVKAKDDAASKALAARDDPDPWLVADELIRRGEFDAADAFALAAPRKDTEKLPAYVASRRGKTDDAAARGAIAAANAAFAAKNLPGALEALGSADAAPPADVVGVRRAFGRGTALAALGRLEGSAAAFLVAADAADRVGWLARASGSLHQSGMSAYRRSDFRGALSAWERRLAIDEARGDRAGAAATCGNIGSVHGALGTYSKALEYLERGLKEAEAAGQRPWEASALANIGNVHKSLGNYPKALEYSGRALKLLEDLGDRAGAARVLGNVGNVHDLLGNYPKALEYFERVLKMTEDLGDRVGTAAALGNIGGVHIAIGNLPKALECLEQAQTMMKGLGDRAGAARTLVNISLVHLSLGSYPKALEYGERALEASEDLGDRAGAAAAHGNIGSVHFSLGNYPKALESFERALKTSEDIGDRAGAATTLVNIGGVHASLGNYPKALEYDERALEMKEGLGNRAGVAVTLANIGVVHHYWLGNYPKALEYYERALKMMLDLGDREGAARTLGNVGILARETGDLPRATKSLERAAREAERVRADPVLAFVLRELAKTELAAGDSRGALFNAKRAIPLLERMLGGLAEEQGADARGGHAELFGAGALAAARTDDVAEAVFFLESGRAGALMESLGGRQALRWQALPEDLRQADAEARAAESVALALYTKALDVGDLAETRSALQTLDAARAKVGEVVERIQRAAKKDAKVDLFYPRAATLEEVEGWLGNGEALILYGLCLDEALAVVLTKGDARIVALGKAVDVTSACEALVLKDPAVDPEAALAALAKILVAPLGLGADITRVLVSPEGPISYVPMALLFPDRSVAYESSGTTYGLLLEDRAKKGEQVLALGDPDYRVKFDPRALEVYAVAQRGGGRLVPLPGTRDEAKAVGDLTLLGSDASEAGLRASIAGHKGRWHGIHFACHGLVDPERPTLSSLALTPDAENDGFLTVREVLRMEVPADLVVLSACETGKGKIVKGEGIVGLTRAFMYAGTPRVICSLWKVDDEATRALMTKFYELWNPSGVNGGKPGLPTAEALRLAQEFVRSQEKWKHPYFWAAWVLWGLSS